MSSGGRSDEDARKLFVGGLPTSATKEEVQEYFEQYGPVEMCTIKTDVVSGRSRGFGFLIYADTPSVSKVLGQRHHELGGKKIDPKLATPQQSDSKPTKIFLGGIDRNATEDDIRSALSHRGTVTDVYYPIDKESNEHKGFAFVTFDDPMLVQSLCDEGEVLVGNKQVQIKRANNKNESRGGMRGGMRGGSRGGYGGRGGFQGGDSYGNGGGYGSGGYSQGYEQQPYGGGYTQQQSYGGASYGSYDQYGSSGYDQSAGYGGGSGAYSTYDASNGYASGGQDQYKMKGGRGRGGYAPY